MGKTIPYIQDLVLKDQIVLLRVDHNVVKNGIIKDSFRIDQSIGTIVHILAKGAKIIMMTHVGRPRDKKTGEIDISQKSAIDPIIKYLTNKLQIRIKTPQLAASLPTGLVTAGDNINELIAELRANELDLIYLPNTRWFAGEEAQDERSPRMAKILSGLADIYVNDAFGSWQPHTSTYNIAQELPAYAGTLMQKEITNLDKIYEAKKPLLAVIAGSKFDTKIKSLNALLKKAEHLFLGGVIFNAYLCAKYNISIKGIDVADIDSARHFIEFAKDYQGKILEPAYVIESASLDNQEDIKTVCIADLAAGSQLNYVLDVAPESFDVPLVRDAFKHAQTIFVNAVMGFTPNFYHGTLQMYRLIGANKLAMKLFGGGDTLQELRLLTPDLYLLAGDAPDYYLFTGGGAVLKAIEEGSTYGIKPIEILLK